jgi:muconolactone delta-isomerase
MNSSILRHVWSIVEETQTTTLLKFSDADLIQQLLTQVKKKTILTNEEISIIDAYISSRVPLIRDIALARLA